MNRDPNSATTIDMPAITQELVRQQTLQKTQLRKKNAHLVIAVCLGLVGWGMYALSPQDQSAVYKKELASVNRSFDAFREKAALELRAAIRKTREDTRAETISDITRNLSKQWRTLHIENGIAMTIKNNRWATVSGTDFKTLEENAYPVLCYVRSEQPTLPSIGLAGDLLNTCFLFPWSGKNAPESQPRFLSLGKNRVVTVLP